MNPEEQAMMAQQQEPQEPAEEKFEYKRNPSSDIMARREVGALRAQDAQVAAEQQAQAQAEQEAMMNSPEAQRKNAYVASKLRDGSLDDRTAQIIVNDPMIHPQLKEVIGGMMQQQQAQEMPMAEQEMMPEPSMPQRGLGAVG